MSARRILALLLLFVPHAADHALAEDSYTLIITGAAGDETYAERYTAWRQSLVEGLRSQPGFRDDHLVVLSATPSPGVGRASREGVTAAVEALRERMTDESVVLIVLIGHGTYDGVDAKFNLVGPDFDAEDWDRLVDRLPGRTVFVNTTASSYPFVSALAQRGRVVISATASPVQRYDTVFPRFFVDALETGEADSDKDGRVSAWEAFSAASTRVRLYYQQHGRLATERALLDDSGDGIGAEADRPGADGRLAARLYVGAGVASGPDLSDPTLVPLIAERDALQRRVAALKAQKAYMTDTMYATRLERLLIDLARASREIRHALQELPDRDRR